MEGKAIVTDQTVTVIVHEAEEGLAPAVLGTMLGTFIKPEGQASGLSLMLGMVMALMGGCWF